MGQLILVDEDEYYEVKRDAEVCNLLIKKLDEECGVLYPDIPYWCDFGTNADVAFIQIDFMSEDIQKYQNKGLINKIKNLYKFLKDDKYV